MKAFVTLLYSLVLSKQSQQHGRTLMDPLTNTNMNNNAVAFSHIQLYVDRVKDLHEYKRLEEQLNEFDAHCRNNNYRMSIAEKKATWKSITGDNEEEQYTPQNRDVVRQLLAGLGFRVTGARCQPQAQTNTKSVLVTSKDPKGLQILVTAVDPDHTNVKDELGFFDAGKWCGYCPASMYEECPKLISRLLGHSNRESSSLPSGTSEQTRDRRSGLRY